MQHQKRKFFILIPIAIVLLLPLVIMFLWNNIVIVIWSITAINYLQALGLFVLSRILFGNIGFGKRKQPPFGNTIIKEKFMNLNADEKSNMQQEWEKRKCQQ